MTLQAIRDMRLTGKKPTDVVLVVIGKLPKSFQGDPVILQILPGDTPALTDWRPLVGCWVSVYNVANDLPLMGRVMDALFAAGVKMFGFVHDGVAYPLTKPSAETDKEVSASLKKMWVQLCKS